MVLFEQRENRIVAKSGVALLFMLLLLPFSLAALEVAIDDSSLGEIGLNFEAPTVPINYSTINTNYSDNSGALEGRDTSTLYSYFESLFNSVYCKLTGCTMTGDIDLGSNSLSQTNFEMYNDGTNQRFVLSSGGYNVIMGSATTGEDLTTGTHNILMALDAGKNINTGEHNIVLGNSAGRNINSGDRNIVLGYKSGQGLTTGTGNTFLGYESGSATKTGNYNFAMGYSAGSAIPDGSIGFNVLGTYAGQNAASGTTAIGYEAARSQGAYSTAIGYQALKGGTGADGNYNVGIGSWSGYDLTDGQQNTFIGGKYTGTNVNTGDYNIFIGSLTGSSTTSGSSNILIGQNVEASSATASNELNIGGILKGSMVSGSEYLSLPLDNEKLYQGAAQDYSQYYDGTDQNFNLTSGEFVFNGGRPSAPSGSTNSEAWGSGSSATGTNALAFGRSTTAGSAGAVAIGVGTNAGLYATGIGYYSKANGYRSTAIGWNAFTEGTDSIAIGYNSYAKDQNSMAFGTDARTFYDDTVVFGSGSRATGINEFVIGASMDLRLPADNQKLTQGAADDYSQYFDGTNQVFNLTSGEYHFHNSTGYGVLNAHDFVTHTFNATQDNALSSFKTEDYQTLTTITDTTKPVNITETYEVCIPQYENITTKECYNQPAYEETLVETCGYVKELLTSEYNYKCDFVPTQTIKQNCHTEEKCNYEPIFINEEKTGKFQKVCENVEICEDVEDEICEDIVQETQIEDLCHNETIEITTYPYTKQINGTSQGQLLADVKESLKDIGNTMTIHDNLVEFDDSIMAENIFTQSKVINLVTNYAIKFLDRNSLSNKAKHKNKDIVLLDNGEQEAVLNVEDRIVDLEGAFANHMTCLYNNKKYADYQECMLE